MCLFLLTIVLVLFLTASTYSFGIFKLSLMTCIPIKYFLFMCRPQKKTSLTSPLFIEVPVPSQESELSMYVCYGYRFCICFYQFAIYCSCSAVFFLNCISFFFCICDSCILHQKFFKEE